MSSRKRESRKATVQKKGKVSAASRSRARRASAERKLGRLVVEEIKRQFDLAVATRVPGDPGLVIIPPCIPWSSAAICRPPIPKTDPISGLPEIDWSPVIEFRYPPNEP
jgi:hypothetical protein